MTLQDDYDALLKQNLDLQTELKTAKEQLAYQQGRAANALKIARDSVAVERAEIEKRALLAENAAHMAAKREAELIQQREDFRQRLESKIAEVQILAAKLDEVKALLA